MSKQDCQRKQMLQDFLRLHSGDIIDAMMASRVLYAVWGIRSDWHEMADALISLVNSGHAQERGQTRDGFVKYAVDRA